MFDFFAPLPFFVGLVIGALMGVGLGRRSKTANTAYDRSRAEWDELRAEVQDLSDRLRNKD